MRNMLLLAVLSASFCFSTLIYSANSNAPLSPRRILSPRAAFMNCGPSQNRILSALLVEIGNWASYALHATRLGDLEEEEIRLGVNAFNLILEGRYTPERNEIRHRFEALRWEVERSPRGRVRASGRVMLSCSTCADERDRAGYNLFAIDKGRMLLGGIHVIKIVFLSLPWALHFRTEDLLTLPYHYRSVPPSSRSGYRDTQAMSKIRGI